VAASWVEGIGFYPTFPGKEIASLVPSLPTGVSVLVRLSIEFHCPLTPAIQEGRRAVRLAQPVAPIAATLDCDSDQAGTTCPFQPFRFP
jgi:hypothetical protein